MKILVRKGNLKKVDSSRTFYISFKKYDTKIQKLKLWLYTVYN